MKKRLLITAIACVLSMGLVACGGGNEGGGNTPTPTPGPVDPEYTVAISNKEALQQPWKVGDDARSVGISPIKGVNIAEAIEQGLIKITSDHPEIVSVEGRLLSPVGVGTATITVTYKEKSDSVAIEVSQASLFKMIAEPQENTDYYVGHKHYDGSGKMVFMRNSVSSNFYLGFELEQENALYAHVKIDTSATDDYKYQISFTTTDAEGVETTKFVGVANTAKGKFAAGIAGETPEGQSFTPSVANFKLDDQYRLVVKIVDTYDDNKEYELVLGASAGYNTFGLGDAAKIMWPARIYQLSDEAIPATSMTVTPEELKLAPGTVGKISYELQPVETTDSVTFETSDKEVATVDVSGAVTAVAEGTATITVKANENVSKTVSVTVEGETVNYGTKEAPLSVAEAKTALDALGAGVVSPVPMYVEGEVYSMENWSESNNNGELWLKDAEGKKAFELYRCVGAADEEGRIMDISGLANGDKVKAYGYAKIHNGTYELTTSGGNPANPTVYWMEVVPHPEIPEPTLVTGKTIAEFLADDSGELKQLYELTGEVTKFKNGTNPDEFGNVYIKDEAGTELYCYGATATATALSWDSANGLYKFSNPKDFLTNELTKDVKVGDKLTIKATLTSYKGNPQAYAIVTAVEEGEGGGGGGEEIPEPALVTGKTIAEFKADASGEFKQLYELTGTVTKWNKGSDAGKYGNFYIEDESGELLIYGSTASEGKLAWDATQGKYVLNNPQDFLTNEVTKDMKIGDTVTVHATLTSYQGNPQAQAQVMSVTPGTPGEDIPEPALVTGKTIAEFKADASGEFKQLYELTGTVTKWNKGSDAGKYGNFYIEDESGELLIYGSTASEGKLAWDATQGKYVLNNPQDFLTNEVTKDMKIGDTVTVHATLTSYQGNPQAQAQVMSVTPGEVPPLTGIKFDVEGESIELIEGRTKAIKLLPLPALAELPEEDPTWESSDPEVAYVADGNNVGGLITAVKEGTAKITAKYSDEIKAELTVNVVKDSGEQGDYVDAVMTKGTNGYDDVTVNNKAAIKVGTSKLGGDMTITVGAGATELVFYACAWNGVTGLALNITGATVDPASVNLTADSAVAGSDKNYAISDETQYKFVIALSGITEETVIKLESSIAKRFVVWGAQYK